MAVPLLSGTGLILLCSCTAKAARHLGPGGRRIRAVRSLSKDFTGVGYNQKSMGINLFQVAAQKHGLSPGEDGEHHVVLRVGIAPWACHTVAPRPRDSVMYLVTTSGGR